MNDVATKPRVWAGIITAVHLDAYGCKVKIKGGKTYFDLQKVVSGSQMIHMQMKRVFFARPLVWWKILKIVICKDKASTICSNVSSQESFIAVFCNLTFLFKHEKLYFMYQSQSIQLSRFLCRSMEHSYISNKADEERQKRPNYRALLEHDGFLWQHSRNNQVCLLVKIILRVIADLEAVTICNPYRDNNQCRINV